MTVHYYTSSSLDGFIATADHSLGWLFKQDFDEDGPMNYIEFMKDIGVLVMGSSTYEWLRAESEAWPYEQPAFVLTSRELPVPTGSNILFRQGNVRNLFDEIVTAANGKDAWVMGGGDLAGQFADENLLDEVWVQFAPATLGSGQPLLPRALDLELLEVAQNRGFVCGHYRVLKSAN